MTSFIWREAELDDAAGIVAMFAAENRQDSRISVPDQANIKHTLERILSAPNGVATVVINEAKLMVGMSAVMFVHDGEKWQGHSVGEVHVDYRRQGLGTQLLEWMYKCVEQLSVDEEDDSSVQLLTSCQGFMDGRIALFEGQGFEPARSSLTMRRDLSDPLEGKKLANDIDIKLWSEDHDEQLREVFNLAFQDNWGVADQSTEDWRKRFIDTPQFRPDLTYLAYKEDSLIGFCLTEHYTERNKRTGRNEVWMEAIGVHPDWRGRGIASGLMAYAIKNYRAQGFTHAGLDVDAENPTNAVALYMKLGFEEVRREIIYRKRIV